MRKRICIALIATAVVVLGLWGLKKLGDSIDASVDRKIEQENYDYEMRLRGKKVPR